MRTARLSTLALAAVTALLLASGPLHREAAAAGYPDPATPIDFIVPYSVGGGYDMYSRMLTQFVSEDLGTRIRIRNIVGGESMVAMQKLHDAKPDGYTLAIWNPGFLIKDRDVLGKVDYDMTTFTFLYGFTDEPRVIIAEAGGPIADVRDFLEKGRSGTFPLRMSYSGGSALLDARLMESDWGLKMEKIAYSSGSKTRLAVIRGDVHITVSSLGSAVESLASGRAKILLLLNDKPITEVPEAKRWLKTYPALKDVPIPADVGLKPLTYYTKGARAVVAPPGLPDDVKKTLEDALARAIANKDLRKLGEKTDRPFGKGQSSAAYTERMKQNKATLVRIKDLIEPDGT